jgi:caspase 7
MEKKNGWIFNHNFSHYFIFAVVVMTHGMENILYGKDKQYETHRLWEPFTADKCRGLAGKPKLFFIQVS